MQGQIAYGALLRAGALSGVLAIVGLLGSRSAFADDRVVTAARRSPVSLVGRLALADWARPRAIRPSPAPVLRRSLSLNMQGPTAPPPGPLGAPAPAAEEADVTDKWWFWAAIGGVVVTTVVLFLVASGGTDEPRTQLGNMDTRWK
jgi:hypothetical protein